MGIKLVSVMEQEDLTMVEDAPMATEPAADSVETDMLNLTAEEGEIDSLNEGVEIAGDDMEQLDEVNDNLERSLDDGGASPETVEMASVVVESIARRQGIKIAHVSKESFSNAKTRIANTKLAIEGIGDTVKRIWESIVKAITSMWEKVKDWWNNFFDGATKMKARWDSIAAKAKLIKEDKNKEETFESGSLVKAIGGMAPSDKAALTPDSFQKIGVLTEANSGETLTTMSKMVSEWMGKIKDMDSFKSAELPKFNNVNGFTIKKSGISNEGYQQYNGPVFFGNQQIAIVVPKDGEMGKNLFKWFDAFVVFEKAKTPEQFFDSTKITPMSLADINKYAKVGVDDIAGVIDARGDLNKLNSTVAEFIKVLKGFAKDTGVDSEKDAIKGAQASARSASNFATKVGSKYLNVILHSHKVLADYVELSISQKPSEAAAAKK